MADGALDLAALGLVVLADPAVRRDLDKIEAEAEAEVPSALCGRFQVAAPEPSIDSGA